jgi:hypothetical protein
LKDFFREALFLRRRAGLIRSVETKLVAMHNLPCRACVSSFAAALPDCNASMSAARPRFKRFTFRGRSIDAFPVTGEYKWRDTRHANKTPLPLSERQEHIVDYADDVGQPHLTV